MTSMMLLMAGQTAIVYDLSDLNSAYVDTDFAVQTYSVRYWFRVTDDGTVDVTRAVGSNLNDEEQYITPATGKNLWVQATQTGTTFNLGDATGTTWYSLTTAQERSFGLQYTPSGSSDTVSGVVTFKIATDAAGSNIVATSSAITTTVGTI